MKHSQVKVDMIVACVNMLGKMTGDPALQVTASSFMGHRDSTVVFNVPMDAAKDFMIGQKLSITIDVVEGEQDA